VAELTYSQDGTGRQNMIEQLMREIMSYDAEYRQQDELGDLVVQRIVRLVFHHAPQRPPRGFDPRWNWSR